MQAHEVLRAAAAIVFAGWSPGGPGEHARDVDGNPVELWGRADGGTSRVGINPNAARFSAYGAVSKVLAGPGRGLGSGAAMWGRLADTAKPRCWARTYIHPLIQFNADEGRTAEEVVALLLEVASAMEKEADAVKAGRAS